MIDKSDIRKGAEVCCIISGRTCPIAKIQITHSGYVYLCQDVAEGDQCDERFGYQFSWSVGNINQIIGNDTDSFFKGVEVTRVRLLLPPEWDEENNSVCEETIFREFSGA